MHLRTSLRVLALAVLAATPGFAQQTKAKSAVDAPAAAPAAAPTAPQGAPIQRDELTPEQKASMKEADRMRGEKARIDAELALAEAKIGRAHV